MVHTKEFIKKYQEEQLNGETLPERLVGSFYLLACIHVTDTHVSFLLQEKATGEKYLLKRGEAGTIGSLSVERRQQARIGAVEEQYDSAAACWVEGNKEYLLRRYIEGQNLEEYLERNPVLEKKEVLDIVIQICDNLGKLHNLNPPLIHRDIKPQNIILDKYGAIHLIDFETAREFDQRKRKDTRFCGTEETAAPEQYGYAQTDARTDIYAVGKVLCYLLTGDYQIETCRQSGGRLGAIAEKCCAFDPKRRYRTIGEVKRLLLAEQKKYAPRPKRKIQYMIGGMALLTVMFVGGILVGNHLTRQSMQSLVQEEVRWQISQQNARADEGINTENHQPDSTDVKEKNQRTGSKATDGDDLLYRALAASLNKESITEDDFEDVLRVAVIGTTVYDTTENFEITDMIHMDEDYLNNSDHGTIADISLLGRMKNLSEVYLYNQEITDIGVLEGLPIRKLYLSGNRIEDFRVLQKLPQLRELFISKNPVRNLPDFSRCPNLRTLVMNENSVANLDSLKDSSVEWMAIRRLNVINGDYSFLAAMPKLVKLYVWNPETDLEEQISHLSHLKELGVFDYQRADLSFVSPLKNLVRLEVDSFYEQDLSVLGNLTKLMDLNIRGFPVEDLSVIQSFPNLQLLNTSHIQLKVQNLSPIFDCKSLTNVWVNEEQAAYIKEHDPGHTYQIHIE